jgi:hypothetical protein
MAKERPIMFSGPMVRAIQEGRKSQTRRVVKPQPGDDAEDSLHFGGGQWRFRAGEPRQFKCPFGVVGDRLWVKEAWAADEAGGILYRADDTEENSPVDRWNTPLFLKRKDSRITLELIDVYLEHLQDINEENAQAEGVVRASGSTYCRAYHEFWDTQNAERGYAWDSNPFVWRLTFRRVEPTALK